ncbi:MAG: hypothetical protein QUV02_14640 [Maricaulis sp.]|uniref:hypothetical protein n=1 Tax=Maricaulis sp. TaxID=1486257 RepID=UPI001B1EE0AE|nr:hypothetical protein [Maricaulis sp.]MBO6728343.1 hypothetical protein [Maricaulis sp.]MBO6848285.1 hypothetical protein [Maricaulis sp.]MBO6878164.1 hypothetical protein [Maricaulis sp.]MDM7985674.1 hypothetical protein [Maricaulis sp.]
MIVNAARGEVALTLAGRSRRLCLTLGGLARLSSLQPDLSPRQRLAALLDILSEEDISLPNNLDGIAAVEAAVSQCLRDLV